LRYYSEKYLLELTNIINDLKLIFDNLSIVEKIDYDLLELELMSFYDELDFYRKEKRIRHLCWK
jgi:hypothetical protein